MSTSRHPDYPTDETLDGDPDADRLARNSDPLTSHDAAASVTTRAAYKGRLLAALAQRRGAGLTAAEGNAILRLPLRAPVAGKRLPDLVSDGYAIRSSDWRPSPVTGKRQYAYRITRDGLAAAEPWSDPTTPSAMVDRALDGLPPSEVFPCWWPGCGDNAGSPAGWCQHQRRSHGGQRELPNGPITGGKAAA